MNSATLNSNIPIDLTVIGEKEYKIGACNRVWLPKVILLQQNVVENPRDCILGIRVNSQGGEQHPWAIQDGFVLQQSGLITSLWVTVLTKGASSRAYLSAGTDVGVCYGSQDGLSAQVPAPGTSQLATQQAARIV